MQSATTIDSIECDLPAGRLTLQIREHHAQGLGLFHVAQRINPRRPFLFVSTVLGRHIPVEPAVHMQAVRRLADRISPRMLHEQILVMGYAETAVGLGAAVARELALKCVDSEVFYLPSTRHPVDDRAWFSFQEAHSHAPAHHVLRPEFAPCLLDGQRRTTVVLVDDEVTTGATYQALVQGLVGAGIRFDALVLAALIDWSGGRHIEGLAERCRASRLGSELGDQAIGGQPPAPMPPIEQYALLHGTWSWQQGGSDSAPSQVPLAPQSVPTNPCNPWKPAPPALSAAGAPSMTSFTVPRLGLPVRARASASGSASEEDRCLDLLIERLVQGWIDAQGLNESGQVLVIGTGEHVWGPMLLAERLAKRGLNVRFVATTRSPILPQGPIAHKLSFADHFGLGIPMYLHNVPSRPGGWIVVMTECGASSVNQVLRSHLGTGLIVDGRGEITAFAS